MSLLSYNRLVQLVEDGVITNVSPEQINSTSIDITLGSQVLYEANSEHNVLHLSDRDPLKVRECSDQYIYLEPGQFILAQSEQKFLLRQPLRSLQKFQRQPARRFALRRLHHRGIPCSRYLAVDYAKR